ncbi:M24 family metallopeptidase [Candidatus Micrarchaeota archaeon]|nr:M24 family metallopeptidase [Candidatus Micrarchaeota archaeon]
MYLLYRGESFNPNFYYLAGADIDHSFLLAEGSKRTLLVPKMNYELAKKDFDGKVLIYTDWLKDLKKAVGSRKILFIDETSTSASLYKKLKKLTKLKDCSSELSKLRGKKKPFEISKIKQASALTKQLLSELDFSKFKTELEVRNYLLKRTFEMGFEPAFRPIVATNPNSRFPHYESGSVKLRDMVLVDYGLKFENYCSDLTRCYFLRNGTEAEKNYSKLQDIFHDITDALPNFSKGKEVASFQEKLFSKYGLPKPIHSIGHGVGLEVHEYPSLGLKSDNSLPNSVLAIEPGAYFKGYGIRFEETISFDGRKVRIL